MAEWTKPQQDAIDARGRNILVSAAAGSGKTSVLVARVIGMITDPVNPVRLDRILMVTFTKAAAAEMKHRISKSLMESIKANPSDERLREQMNLINSAKISTIDSFCTSLYSSARTYFSLLFIIGANIHPRSTQS